MLFTKGQVSATLYGKTEVIDGIAKSTLSVRIKSKSQDGTKESIAYVTLPNGEVLRSLPNGTKDEVSVSGTKTKRVSDEFVLQSSHFISIDTTSYANIDYIVIPNNIFSNLSPWTINVEGKVRINDSRFSKEIANTSTAFTNETGYAFSTKDNQLILIVPKGTYTSLTDAQSKLTGLSLTYQLATEIKTQVQPFFFTIFPNGSVIVETDSPDSTVGELVIERSTIKPIDSMSKFLR